MAKKIDVSSKRNIRRAKEQSPPLTLPNGTRVKEHPLVWAWDRYKKANPGLTLRAVAAKLDITVQALFIMLREAREDRTYKVPAERVPGLCQMLDIPPYMLRPALWDRGWMWAPRTRQDRTGRKVARAVPAPPLKTQPTPVKSSRRGAKTVEISPQ